MKKYKINTKFIVALLFVAFISSSCENMLTKSPDDRLIKEKFWTKKEDVYAALAASYDAFRDISDDSFVWGELRGDIAEFSTSAHGDYVKIVKNNITPSNGKINWSGYYNAINLANTLMYFSGDVVNLDESFTPELKEGIDAEALFIRSISYFYLVRLWRDVPLVIEPTVSDTLDLFLPSSPEKEVLAQIENDLLYAKDIADTDENIDNPVYYKGRANKYAIMSLLADVYLWNDKYQLCIDYCDSVINTQKFSLETYNEWFNLYYPGNSMKESIFEIQFDSDYDGQSSTLNTSDFMPVKGSSKVKINKLVTSLLFQDNDIRLLGSYSPTWKYVGITNTTKTAREISENDANVIYYRYADILLMKAEALCELDRFSEANDLIRQVADRAGSLMNPDYTKEGLRLLILDERAREFVMEGKRWFDMLRYAKRNDFENKDIIAELILERADDVLDLAVLKTKAYDENFYYLPVPESEIKSNPNLEQNPFYDR